MDLREYFEDHRGMGVLSTTDGDGRVNSAVYARPHVQDDGSLYFIMADKLTHKNLEANPGACYLFKEDGTGWKGARLYLTKLGESADPQAVVATRRTKRPKGVGSAEPDAVRFVVHFKVDQVLPLVGA